MRHTATPRTVLAAAAAFALCGHAAAFELAIAEPALSLSVPDVPSIALAERRAVAPPGARVFDGHDDTYDVELELRPQPGSASPRVCAGLQLRALVARPGMPARDNIYRAPLDANTFLVIYLLGEGEAQRLHAHLISAAGTAHCADAHFTRRPRDGEDIDAWRTTFTSARARPAPP